VPVIFLTAKTEPQDRIEGFESGADDYLAKPFSPKELVLRVEAMFRRLAQPPPSSARLQIGRIDLDGETHRVTVAGEHVELTATEFKLLRLMMERQGRVQTREHLLVNVWNYSAEIETRTVDTHVRRLREKLGPEADWIETIRGVGYRIAEKKSSA
jgi:two-component system phosphate regulon response regulator PhoB